MRRIWFTADILFVLVTGVFSARAIIADRESVLSGVRERMNTASRLISAHADAALEDANKLLLAIADQVSEWDFKDEQAGQLLYKRMVTLAKDSRQISSAWVMDAAGHQPG